MVRFHPRPPPHKFPLDSLLLRVRPEAPPIHPRSPNAPIVLLVEDDPSARELYRQTLVVAGYKVRAVGDGIDALNVIDTDGPPSLVILDLMLPRLGGVDVYRELRARPATRHTPVIIVTGSDARELQPNKVQIFLRKPVYPDTLMSAVEGALERT